MYYISASCMCNISTKFKNHKNNKNEKQYY